MSIGKKNLPASPPKAKAPVLRTYNMDMSKRWHVEHYANGFRQRDYGTINQEKDVTLRLKKAKLLLKSYDNKMPWVLEVEKKFLLYSGIWERKTYQTYYSKFKIFRDFIDGRTLTLDLLKDFFESLLINKKSRTTYHAYYTTLKLLLPKKYTEYFAEIDKIRPDKQPYRYFTKAQRSYIKNYLVQHNPELWFAVQIAYYTGMRPVEIRNLKVCHIIIEEGHILVPGKGQKNHRQAFIKIPNAFIKDLAEKIDGRDINEYVFTNVHGDRLGRDTISKRHQKVLKYLKFDTDVYKMYSWRHTCGVGLHQDGVGVKEIQLHLRHSGLDMTDKYLRQMTSKDVEKLPHLMSSL